MEGRTYTALVVREQDKTFVSEIEQKDVDDLPAGDVLIRVRYSSLNYKDALSATGNPGVTRNYPHTPGIDAAGMVAESTAPMFAVGDEVLVTGYDLGMNTAGGYGQYIRVPAGWVVPRPPALSLKECMIYGTAGFTAGMSVAALVSVVAPGAGEVLVTGATGGVGSIATAILAHLGYRVAVVSGKADARGFLEDLGAGRILSRAEAVDVSERPLLKGQWAGVVDTVGGDILSTAIKSTHLHGIVTCCGNVASPGLSLTVFPFILRGLRLQGIDSQNCPMEHRLDVWRRLAGEWRFRGLEGLCKETGLGGLHGHIALILQGKQTGRVVVDLDE